MKRVRITAGLLAAAAALLTAAPIQAVVAPYTGTKHVKKSRAHVRSFATTGQSGTTLSADVTATAHNGGTATWTIDKAVDKATLDLQTGQSGSVTYTITLTKTPGSGGAFVDGQVCVTNGGGVATEGLAISVDLKHPATTVVASGSVDVSGNPVLDPAESACYAYSIDIPSGEVVAGDTYKVTANVTITNHSGHLGSPFGPSPSATTGALPEGSETNGTVHVTDTNGAGPWTFSDSGSVQYSKEFTCDADKGEHPNTATITQTQQSDDATVTVDCTPPPVDQCPNLEGVQETVPEGMVKDENGDCVTPPVDQCPNLEGVQETIPQGMVKDANGGCVTPSGGGGGGGGGGSSPPPPVQTVTPPPPPVPPAPPVTGTGGSTFTPPAVCGSIKIGIKQLTVGKHTVLRIVVRDVRGKALRGVRVTARGAGVAVSGRTGRKGVARLPVTTAKPGVLTISAGSARCTKRVGVLGVFQPPVTG